MLTLPNRIKAKLESDQSLLGAVNTSLANFNNLIKDGHLELFPEFTDHGPAHINAVMASAASLITDDAWPGSHRKRRRCPRTRCRSAR